VSVASAPLAKGMRHTRQRQAVWEAVLRLGGHCTAEEIAAELEKSSPGFPRSTVYRALDALTSSGALHAVRLGEGAVHYEPATGEHQHAVCQVCNGSTTWCASWRISWRASTASTPCARRSWWWASATPARALEAIPEGVATARSSYQF